MSGIAPNEREGYSLTRQVPGHFAALRVAASGFAFCGLPRLL